MPRKKSYSSELTRLIDLSATLGQGLLQFREELTRLTEDSYKLKELEPLLKDIRRVAIINTPNTKNETITTFPNTPINLCDSCTFVGNKSLCNNSDSENLDGIIIKCPGYNSKPPPAVKEKRKRIRKILATGLTDDIG